ncbi:Unknown protein, partial [Striga hermonthica]
LDRILDFIESKAAHEKEVAYNKKLDWALALLQSQEAHKRKLEGEIVNLVEHIQVIEDRVFSPESIMQDEFIYTGRLREDTLTSDEKLDLILAHVAAQATRLEETEGGCTRLVDQLDGIMDHIQSGTPVREHALKVMAQLNELEVLGGFIDGETQVDIMLQSLPKSFDQFRLNYNMHKMHMALPELLSELQSAEALFTQKPVVVVAEQAGPSRTHKGRKRKKAAGKAMAQSTKLVPQQAVAKKPKVVRRLSPEEVKRRREKGLCFKCEENFTPGRQCKQAFVIEVANSDEEGSEVEEEPRQKDEVEVPDEEAEISMHAMAGIRGPRTMQLPAWVKDRRVVVLVDNGSSHNFINADLSQKLNLPNTKIEPFEVRVANGERLQCTESFRKVPIKFQGVMVKADLYALPLVGPNVVLGDQWLEGLGKVTTDYRTRVMEFKSGGRQVTLSTGTEKGTKEVGLKSIER